MYKFRKYRKYRGFTLVELIVVITILTILWTIWFTQMQGYSSSARDSVRTSDLANLTKGLEVFQIKTGSYPAPVNPVVYTGGVSGGSIILQGTLNGTLIGFSVANPSDPLTKTSYVYSILWNGSYYQIGAELENPLSYSDSNINWNTTRLHGLSALQTLWTPVYADGIKTPLLKGNYTPDPSLPSLVIVPGSVPTTVWSWGIFSPEVCFVTGESSSNILSSGTGTCTKKKAMSLKDLDSGLVGYWDMETTFLSGWVNYLRDLSGNGNDGVFSGAVLPVSTGGMIGGWYHFSSWVIIVWDDINIKFGSEFTLVNIIKVDTYNNPYPRVFANRHFNSCAMNCLLYQNHPVYSWACLWVDYSKQWVDGFWGQVISSSWGTLKYNSWADFLWITGTGIAKSFEDRRLNNTISLNKFYSVVMIFRKDTIMLYVNGVLIRKTMAEGFDFVKHTTDVAGKYVYLWWIAWNNRTRDFNGIIDESKLYSRALTDSEVRQQTRTLGF